jgi:DUF2946 family protein
MRAASPSIRFAWALVFALLLALRSLAPAGFMPAFDHGAVTIVACPDAGAVSSTATMHHHGDHKSVHEHCPFASMSVLSVFGVDWAPVFLPLFFAVALLLGRTFLFIERQSAHERPPAIGPPIPA